MRAQGFTVRSRWAGRAGWRTAPILCVLALNIAVAAGQSAATVSVHELRHSLSHKASAALERALKFLSAGDQAATLKQLHSTLQIPEAAPYALKILGAIHLNQKQMPDALTELQAAADGLPWDPEAQGLLGYALYGANQDDAGAAAAQRALQLDPNSAIAHLALALILFDQRRDETALEHLHKAARNLLPARVILAGYYERTGHPDLAARMYRLAQEEEAGSISDDRVRKSALRWLERHPLPGTASAFK